MARAPADDGAAFLQEVDEEYRRDQLAAIGRRWGLWLAMAVVLLLAAVAGFLYWQERRSAAAAALSEQYLDAIAKLEAGNQSADADLKVIAESADNRSYRTLATLARAALALRADKTDDAVRFYSSVAADTNAAEPFRALATLQAARLRFGSTPPDKLIETLHPYAQPGGPWFGPAGEMTALAYLREGKPQQAAPLFAAIAADASQPEALRLRAAEMATGLGSEIDEKAGQPGTVASSDGTGPRTKPGEKAD